MMYAKLALRNVKRSAKDYLIYVITLILSVGLFYGFMSIASPYYNESLPVKINLEILNKAMRIAVPIVALLVVFLISYVNTYMLRRKQKEFAVQTIIGMEQRTVAFFFRGNYDYGSNFYHFGNIARNRIVSNCWLYCCAVFWV